MMTRRRPSPDPEAASRSRTGPAAGPVRHSRSLGFLLGAMPLWLAACASTGDNTDWTAAVPPPVDVAMGEPAPGTDESRTAEPRTRADQGPFQPNAHLQLCRARLSNAPAVDAVGFVEDFSPLAVANGRVILATAPANDVCLSSGFGPRSGRMHKGVDLVARPAGPIYSAAPGTVREARVGRGFGLYVTIDHGHGVYTRYAHLKSIEDDIRPGTRLGFGQPLGIMGRTGNATATHLHYEVLTGRWGRTGSFGLTALDPLSLPPYDPYLVAAVDTGRDDGPGASAGRAAELNSAP